MSKKKHISAKELLNLNASYSGWLKKYSDKKFSKGYVDRYCVLYKGYLYYFNDHNSRSQSEDLPLACYRAIPKEDKKFKWGISLENIGNKKNRTYRLAVSSRREQEEWIKHLENEIQTNCNCVDAESEEEYDDVKLEMPLEYDYAKTKPDHVVMFDPEPPKKTFKNKSPFSGVDSFLVNENFVGPNLINSNLVSSNSPHIPPRPKHTLLENQKVENVEDEDPNEYIQTYNHPSVRKPVIQSKTEEAYVQMSSCPEMVNENKNSEETEDDYLAMKDDDSGDSSEEHNHYEDALILSKEFPDAGSYEYLTQKEDTTEEDLLPKSVYQWKLTREHADLSLKRLKKNGCYLIRENKEKRRVLSVFDGVHTRHYIIYSKNQLVFLSKEPEPKFHSLVDLVKHYRINHLPTCNTKLETPFR